MTNYTKYVRNVQNRWQFWLCKSQTDSDLQNFRMPAVTLYAVSDKQTSVLYPSLILHVPCSICIQPSAASPHTVLQARWDWNKTYPKFTEYAGLVPCSGLFWAPLQAFGCPVAPWNFLSHTSTDLRPIRNNLFCCESVNVSYVPECEQCTPQRSHLGYSVQTCTKVITDQAVYYNECHLTIFVYRLVHVN